MKRIALISILIGCGTPKSEDDSDWGDSADVEPSTTGGGENDGGGSAATDMGESDAGDTDGADTDDGSSDSGGSAGGETGGEAGDSGGTGGEGSEGDATDGTATDGGATGGDSGGDSGDSDSGTTGGGSGSECLVDVLNFSATISDSDGACSSPCDADDVLSYHLVIENESLSDCVLTTSSTCLIENVQIDIDVVHDLDPAAVYAPMCGMAITEHIIPAGGSVEETLEGGLLDPGNYIASINVDMDSSLATGSKAFSVE